MVGVEYVYFIQTNDLDLKKRTMEIVAKNETFASRIDVIEKCKYYVSFHIVIPICTYLHYYKHRVLSVWQPGLPRGMVFSSTIWIMEVRNRVFPCRIFRCIRVLRCVVTSRDQIIICHNCGDATQEGTRAVAVAWLSALRRCNALIGPHSYCNHQFSSKSTWEGL